MIACVSLRGVCLALATVMLSSEEKKKSVPFTTVDSENVCFVSNFVATLSLCGRIALYAVHSVPYRVQVVCLWFHIGKPGCKHELFDG